MAKDFDWQQFGRNVRNQKRFATDITDVANFMMRVDGEAVNGRIAGKLSTQELASAIDVSIIQANSVIDPTRIYCSLTGQPIGTRGADNIKLALQIHGVSRYEELVKFNVQTAVAEHWQATAGRDLSKLAEADPYGYFVYAASKAYVRYYKNLVEKKENDTAEAQLHLVKQRIDLYAKIYAQYDLETIVRANEAWRNFLSLIDPAYARTLIAFPCQVLADFATREVMDFLQYQLTKTLAEIVYKETKYRGRVSVADITRIGDKFHGLSSFRHQHRITGEDEGDLIARLIAENVSPLVPTSAADKSHGSSWQRRAENQPPKRSRGQQYQGQSFKVDPATFKLKVSDETIPLQAKAVKQEIVLPREAEVKKPTMLDVFKQFKRKE